MKIIFFFILSIYSLIFAQLSNQKQAALFVIGLFFIYLIITILKLKNKFTNLYAEVFILSIFLGLTTIVHIKHLVIQPYQVENQSMYPFLESGDSVIVEKISMGFIISFYEQNKTVKRLTFPLARKLKEGDVIILKNPLNEENIIKRIHSIENNKYCVMGDNRNQSLDSRKFGCVDENLIIGRMIFHFKMAA